MRHVKAWFASITIAAIFLTACSRNNNRDLEFTKLSAEVNLIYKRDLFGRDISLAIINHGTRPICFPRKAIAATSPNFILRQNGVVVPPQYEENRGNVAINGVDVAEGLVVVPSEKKRNFFINVEDFALDASKFSATFQLDVLDCAELFSAPDPRQQTLRASVTGSLPARQANP